MSLWGVNVFEKRSVNENEVEYLNFKIFKKNYGFYGISVKNNFYLPSFSSVTLMLGGLCDCGLQNLERFQFL